MNGPEMKNIERWLERPGAWPLTQDDYAAILRRAKQERAEYMATVVVSLGSRISRAFKAVRGFAAEIRGNAQSCTEARLHHS